MQQIILSTLNARYIHCSLGLRYLKANMGELQKNTIIREYIINGRAIDIAEDLLKNNPQIIGFGVYIWNIEQTTQLVALIKEIRPDITIIVGGPEISFEQEKLPLSSLADFVISGQADLVFSELCQQIFSDKPPADKIINAPPVPIPFLQMPYEFYSEEDVKNRVIYIEASRGCPFKCEFCLSALDKTATPFDIDLFLDEMEKLHQRGVRHFKFVDRTFNLKIATSIQILEFFLEKMDETLFLHFELIPDHLPEKLKSIIKQFPEGSLQFEIGIQSFNPDVQKLISRKQNNEKSKENIKWLKEHSNAHLHTDLILGLPGENIKSIQQGFDQLVNLDPHEIQVGILKRLRGTPIIRHTEQFDMRYSPNAPYNLLCNKDISFSDMQRLNRFARYWDLVANSGRFINTRPLILGDSAFDNFLRFSDWLYQTTNQTFKIALEKLFELIYRSLTDLFHYQTQEVSQQLWKDYLNSGLKGYPSFANQTMIKERNENKKAKKAVTLNRQARHIT